MRTIKSTIIILLVALINLSFGNNKCNKNFHSGEVILNNGSKLQGNIYLKKNYNTYEVLYKKHEHSSKTQNISIQTINQLKIGDKTYIVSSIKTDNNNSTIALLEKIVGNDAALYHAKYIEKKQQGKNNHTFVEVEKHLLAQDNQYVILNDKDYKQKLKEFWADEQMYLNKLTEYENVNKEELIQILLD